MESLVRNPPRRRTLLFAGIASVLVSAIAIGSLAISSQNLKAAVLAAAPPKAAAAPSVTANRTYPCAECGRIESMREVAVAEEETGVDSPSRMAAAGVKKNSAGNYEITVRMQNGSMRVLEDAYPARWRLGERVVIIAGVI